MNTRFSFIHGKTIYYYLNLTFNYIFLCGDYPKKEFAGDISTLVGCEIIPEVFVIFVF